MDDHPFADLAAFTALPRLTGLALGSGPEPGLVASMQEPDAKGSRYVSSLWQIPLDDGAPLRLTRSEQGESSPACLPGGSLLFVSGRADADAGPVADRDDDDAALWLLPPSGEPRVVARSPGGISGPVVAADTGTIVVSGSRLAWTGEADDAERRRTRKDRKITAILHTGMPIRYWDHELGDQSPRLLAVAEGRPPRDLTPNAGQALHEAEYSISADGASVLTSWRVRRRNGRTDLTTVLIDVASGERTTIADEDGASFYRPRLAPDGRRFALGREDAGTFESAFSVQLQLRDLHDGGVSSVDLGDLYPEEWSWSRDSRTLFVAGDLRGRGAVLAVDADTGSVSRLADDATYTNLCPSPDGRHVYALRSAIDAASTPVRLDVALVDQEPAVLSTPAPTPPLPGTLVEIVPAEASDVHAWLCLPPAAEQPAPLMLWIHGGPFASYNSWSWRWNPWAAVARGYAVLMPDPALSTGYGMDLVERAWPHRASIVWSELEAVLEAVLQRPDVDAGRTACLGGSFGGYMTNWIAGHTGRFDAIVTHAGLWALDQQHKTTDLAEWKSGLFGAVTEHPDWYAENSPSNFVDAIVTPMLIVHGDRDYRVPISEALRLWWDLVSHHDGEPSTVAHRFLQLTGENHWVLSPANAQIWYETVLGFCDQHVRGRPFQPSPLL
ncbi:MAG: prolyl oligopeptidase family serine peptidase [Jatrophihabitantaceae bacterium]